VFSVTLDSTTARAGDREEEDGVKLRVNPQKTTCSARLSIPSTSLARFPVGANEKTRVIMVGAHFDSGMAVLVCFFLVALLFFFWFSFVCFCDLFLLIVVLDEHGVVVR